jgi:hypothetical protein
MNTSASAPAGVYLPLAVTSRYATPLVTQPSLPLTPLGHLLSRIGLSPATINADVREGAAKDEQLFVIVGFAGFLLAPRLRRRVNHELLYLGAGGIFMVGLFTIFPDLSVDYGTLRAFQEALILTAPVLVAGSVIVFAPFGRPWNLRMATAVCVAFFISTTGLLPQLLGGYPAQLSLNDSGQYYDVYYPQPADVAAENWMVSQADVRQDGLQTALGTTTASSFVSGSYSVADIYPVLIFRSSWVMLNSTIVHTGRAPLSAQGQVLAYKYPVQMLQDNKNLVYDNGGAEIYR